MSCLQVATFNAPPPPPQSRYRTRKRVTLSWGKERVVVPRIRGEKDRITIQGVKRRRRWMRMQTVSRDVTRKRRRQWGKDAVGLARRGSLLTTLHPGYTCRTVRRASNCWKIRRRLGTTRNGRPSRTSAKE